MIRQRKPPTVQLSEREASMLLSRIQRAPLDEVVGLRRAWEISAALFHRQLRPGRQYVDLLASCIEVRP